MYLLLGLALLGSSVTVGALEVLERLLGVGLHGGFALLPARRAHLTVLVCVLEGFDKAQHFVDVAAHWQVVDCDLAEHTLRVDNEQAAEGRADVAFAVLHEHFVLLADLLADIADERNFHLAQTALLARRVDPGQVRELGVDGATQHSRVQCFELGNAVRERDDLGRAHEREVQRVEEQHDVLALVVRQRDGLKLTINYGVGREHGGRLADRENHC